MSLFRRRFWLLALYLIPLAALPLLGRADDDAPAGRQYALLVGVKNYKKGELKSLKYTENDANDLADVLKDAGYRRVVVMTQAAAVDDQDLAPTGPNIREQLRSLLEDRRAGDTVLVAFSGHGVQFKGQDDHYFCPADARLADRNTLISLSEVYDALKGCKAEMKLLVVDACRADPQPDDKGPAKVDLESVTRPQAERPPGGVAALFSCSEGQRSYESDAFKHGVFFHYLIEGMKGEAANKKGEVTLERLASYIADEVPERAKALEGPSARQLPCLVGELTVAAVLATTGGADMKESPYFPLGVGTKWTYKQTIRNSSKGGSEETHEETRKVLKHEKIGMTMCAQIELAVDGKTYPMFFTVTEDGVFQAVTDGTELKKLICLLKLPPEKDGQEITVAGKRYTAVAVTVEHVSSGYKWTQTDYFVKGIGRVKDESREEFTSDLYPAYVITSVRELEKFEPGGK